VFIKGESLDGFVAMCARDPAEVHYAVVAREAIEAEFPGVERTYVNAETGTEEKILQLITTSEGSLTM